MLSTPVAPSTINQTSNSITSSTSQQSHACTSHAERNRMAQRTFQQRQRDTLQRLEAQVLDLQRRRNDTCGDSVQTQPPTHSRTRSKPPRNLKHVDTNQDLSHLSADERRTVLNRLAQRASRQRRKARITELTAQVYHLQNELALNATSPGVVTSAAGSTRPPRMGQPPVLGRRGSLGTQVCLPALLNRRQELSGAELPSLRSLGLLDLSEGCRDGNRMRAHTL